MISTLDPTRYEVALMRGEKILHVYGYTARKSNKGMLSMIRHNVEHLLTQEELAEIDKEKRDFIVKNGRARVATNLFIGFSGRTEREVKNNVAV